MERELKSLQSKILDLENKICFAHTEDSESLTVDQNAKTAQFSSHDKLKQTRASTTASKSRADSSDAERSANIKRIA